MYKFATIEVFKIVSNFDMVFYTLAFVVPGFITNTILAMFVPQKNEQAPNSILKFLYFSCINYALWAWLIYLLIKSSYFSQHIYRTAAIWFFLILVSPLLIGLGLGLLSKRDTARKLLQKFGINTIHTIPTGWDYKFSNIEHYRWLIVTLKDNSVVYGYFGSSSFASSDNTERDIYIEKVYKITEEENGKWIELERNDGILIKSDQIKHIEFLK